MAVAMSVELNQQQAENKYVLEEIRALPLALDKPLYRNYPAMKLGQLQQIDFFSQQLFVMAADILRNNVNVNVNESTAKNNNWVITAPAYYQLPAAANLLARKVHKLLQQQDFAVSLVEPRLSQQQIVIGSQEEFKSYHDYSKNNLQQRIAERQRVQIPNADRLISYFKNQSVMIINDINVTGTQQRFMQQMFDELQVKSCHWLYILNVDAKLAEDHPEIEYHINSSQISDLDSYGKILGDEKTQHTARCIARLFNEEFNDFYYLVTSLNQKMRELIYFLAEKEERYSNALFADKMNLLATSSHSLSVS